jgi:hypothetical protein
MDIRRDADGVLRDMYHGMKLHYIALGGMYLCAECAIQREIEGLTIIDCETDVDLSEWPEGTCYDCGRRL